MSRSNHQLFGHSNTNSPYCVRKAGRSLPPQGDAQQSNHPDPRDLATTEDKRSDDAVVNIQHFIALHCIALRCTKQVVGSIATIGSLIYLALSTFWS